VLCGCSQNSASPRAHRCDALLRRSGAQDAIRAAVPGLEYAVFRKRAYYGLPDHGWIIEIAPYDVSVNVVFFGGADFTSPPALGAVDRTRYVKVTSIDEVERPELLDWLKQSGHTPGWK
jgi:hypothetical protein